MQPVNNYTVVYFRFTHISLVQCESKKDQRHFSLITLPNVGRFLRYFHHWIEQKIFQNNLLFVPPQLNCVANTITSIYL